MKISKRQTIKKGFTLLEAVIGIFIIVVGLVGGLSAVLQIVSLSSVSSGRLTAAYLAQEGIEIIRNIRDTNWLEARTATSTPWDEGLTGCAAGCVADYNHSYGPNPTDPNLPAYSGQSLNIGGSGFYGYAAGTATTFKRKITIQKPASDRLEVTVEVTWTEKGKPYSFSTKENLYNWQQ
jgi:hypothetical protein